MIKIAIGLLLFFACLQSIFSQPFRSVTLQKDTVDCFSGNGKTIFILSNIYSCADCFKNLNSALANEHLKNAGIDIIVFCHPSTSASSDRRRMFNQMKSLIPIADTILFEIQSEDSDAVLSKNEIFGAFAVDYTPAVLVWDNKTGKALLFLKYANLIDKKGMVLADAIPKILQVLK